MLTFQGTLRNKDYELVLIGKHHAKPYINISSRLLKVDDKTKKLCYNHY